MHRAHVHNATRIGGMVTDVTRNKCGVVKNRTAHVHIGSRGNRTLGHENGVAPSNYWAFTRMWVEEKCAYVGGGRSRVSSVEHYGFVGYVLNLRHRLLDVRLLDLGGLHPLHHHRSLHRLADTRMSLQLRVTSQYGQRHGAIHVLVD